jgi:hypothetical protein
MGVAGVHTSRLSELMHPAHALTTTKNPLKQTCSGGAVLEVAALSSRVVWGTWRCCVGPWQTPYFKVREPLQTCTACFHTSRTLFLHPEFCYELSMGCALMACYVLESSECGSSGHLEFFYQGLGV